jgi:hypothetical protein
MSSMPAHILDGGHRIAKTRRVSGIEQTRTAPPVTLTLGFADLQRRDRVERRRP